MTSLFGRLQAIASDFKIGVADVLLLCTFLSFTEKKILLTHENKGAASFAFI